MRRNLTYPKDGERKLREIIRQLKTEVGRLRKENFILRSELNNIMKPERPRKEHVEEKGPQKMTREQWRKDFVKKFKPGLDKRLEEIDDEEKDD